MKKKYCSFSFIQKAQITNNHRMLIEFWLKRKNIFWPSQDLWDTPCPSPLPSSLGGGQVKNFRKVFPSGGDGIKKFYFGGLVGVWKVFLHFRITSLIYFRCIRNTLICFIKYTTLRFLVFPFFVFQVLQMLLHFQYCMLNIL